MYKVLLSFFFFATLFFPLSSRSEIRICATKEQIQSFCSTNNVKVVFIFNSKIHLIDFSQDNPVVTVLTATNGAINPVISPNGYIVAYTTGIDADPPVNKSADIYTCSLTENAKPSLVVQGGYVPRFDYAATEPVLVYSTCGILAEGKDYVWNGCGKVMKKNLSNGETTAIFENGSYFGGLSYDGRFLATAESSPNAFLMDLQNQQLGPAILHRIRVKKQSTGKDTTFDLQTCNPSVSSSRIFTNTMMYFDFSSGDISDAGCSNPVLGDWEQHQRIFISRYNGDIMKIFDAPIDGIAEKAEGKGEIYYIKWSNPEWSNHPYYATALAQVDRLWKETVFKHSYHNEWLYLINLKDSVYLKLAEVTDTTKTSTESMLWPWVWVETPSNFSEDPTWLGTPISVKKRAHVKELSSKFQIRNNLLKIKSDRIIQIRLFTHDGRILWSKSFKKGQNEVLLPSEIISGKVVLCDITLDSGKYNSVSFFIR